MYTDKGRLKQILLNLMSNSLKFTFKGGIIICVSRPSKELRNVIEISVQDTGIGIKNEDQENLFKLFTMINDTNGFNPNG